MNMQGLDNMKISKKFHKLPDYIINANLESPKLDNVYQAEQLKISGWFLAKSDATASDVQIIIKNLSNDTKYLINSDVERQDVIDVILGGENVNQLKPGFQKIIPWSNHIQILFYYNGIEHLWYEILTLNETDYHAFTEKWKKLNSEEYEILENEKLTDIEKKWLYNEYIISYDINHIINRICSEQTEKDVFYNFIERVDRWDFLLELCDYKNKKYIRSCFNNSKANIIGSLCVGNLNILKVKDSVRIYYIFQNISSCDAIYIPDRNILLCLSYIEYYQYLAFIDNIHLFNEKAKDPVFGGYITYYNRPYHYMYDMMLGLYYANSNGVLSDDDRFIAKSGSDFLNLEKLFNISTVTNDDITFSKDMYYIRIGVNFGVGAKEKKKANYIECLDNYLRAQIKSNKNINNDNSFTLWFGITSQKRAWIEQVEAIAYITNNLEIQNKKLRIIFDGWTSPLNKSELDKKEIISDQKLVDEIISKINRDVEIINLIGSTIEEKINVAEEIDFFVVNYATGSLNVARVCKKRGIAHISNSFIKHAAGQHFHPNSILIDPEFVNEIPSIYDFAHYSYSIKKEVVFELTQKSISACTLI